jgi:BlaI family penicillinase repressor
LVGKGILKQEKRDVYYYTASVTKQEYNYAKTKELINRSYSGSAKDLVATLLKQRDFTPEDFDELKQIWSEGVEQK